MNLKTIVWIVCLGLHVFQSVILRENAISTGWIIAVILFDQGYLFTTGSATLDVLLNIIIYVLDVFLGFLYNLFVVPLDILLAITGNSLGQILFRIGLEAGSFPIALIYLIILAASYFLRDGDEEDQQDQQDQQGQKE